MSAQMFQPPSHEDVQAGQEYEIAINNGNSTSPAYPGVWRVESKAADPTKGVTLVGPDGAARIVVLAWDLFPVSSVAGEVPAEKVDVTLTERIEADLLHITFTDAEPSPGFPAGSRGFAVTVHGFGRRLRTPFTMGPLAGDRPEIGDILSSMLSESAGYHNADGYADWLSEYGMTDDSQSAATYAAVAKQYNKLAGFFGDRFDDYLWQTQNDV